MAAPSRKLQISCTRVVLRSMQLPQCKVHNRVRSVIVRHFTMQLVSLLPHKFVLRLHCCYQLHVINAYRTTVLYNGITLTLHIK